MPVCAAQRRLKAGVSHRGGLRPAAAQRQLKAGVPYKGSSRPVGRGKSTLGK